MTDIQQINKKSTVLMKNNIEYRVSHNEEHSKISVSCDLTNEQLSVLALEGFSFSSGLLSRGLYLVVENIK